MDDAFRTIKIRGVQYHVYEAGEGTPLLMLHGFTGSHEVFQPFVRALGKQFHCIVPDLLGHGQTDAPLETSRYAMDETLADLACLLDEFDIPRAHVFGYSMGGRIALSFAASFPQRVHRLVLEGASPGLRTEEERRARRASDDALATKLESQGVAAFVRDWEEIPLFASQKRLPKEQFLRQRAVRESQRVKGLAASLRGIGTGAQPSMWPHLSEIEARTLLITGELDRKFTGIASDMSRQLPHCDKVVIANAGHTPHVEEPQSFISALADFLTS